MLKAEITDRMLCVIRDEIRSQTEDISEWNLECEVIINLVVGACREVINSHPEIEKVLGLHEDMPLLKKELLFAIEMTTANYIYNKIPNHPAFRPKMK